VGERTSVAKAHSKSQSLRTTIPDGVKHTLDIKEKDVLDWQETRHEGDKAYIVKKVTEK
jgi:hypothetical protein